MIVKMTILRLLDSSDDKEKIGVARLSLKLVLSRTKPKQALSTLTSVLKPI